MKSELGGLLDTPYTPSDIARGTGYSLSHISRLFAGKSKGSMDSVPEIAAFLGVPVERLMRWLEARRLAYAAASREKRGKPVKTHRGRVRPRRRTVTA